MAWLRCFRTPMVHAPSTGRLFRVLLLVVVGCITAAGFAARPVRSGQATRPGGSAGAAELEAGEMVYERWCAICHYSDSTANKIGPGLQNLYARGTFTDDKKVDDAALTYWIEKGGQDMPGYKDALRSDEIHALVAYIKTL